MLKDLKKNIDRKLKEIRKMIDFVLEHKENINIETKIKKTNQTELKTTK